jgi:hypothetical protein
MTMPIAMKATNLLAAIALGAGMSFIVVEDAEAKGRRGGGSNYQNRGGSHHAHRHHGHHRHHAYRHHHHRHRGYAHYGYGLGFGFGLGSLAYRDPYFWDYSPPPRAYYVPPAAYPVEAGQVDPPYPPVPTYQPAPIPGFTDQGDGAGSDMQAPGRVSAVVTDDPASWPLP